MNKEILLSLIILISGASFRLISGVPIQLNSKKGIYENNSVYQEMKLKSYSSSSMFLYIFKNNLLINLTLMLGFLSFGLLNTMILAYNGYNLVHYIVISYYLDIPPKIIFYFLAPHGFIEIFAMILSSAIGFSIIRNFKSIYSLNIDKNLLKSYLYNLTTVFILTVVAAFIESNYTLKIVREYAI